MRTDDSGRRMVFGLALGLLVGSAGCSSAETKVSGPVSAEMEAAIKQEQQSAEEAELARQKEAAQ